MTADFSSAEVGVWRRIFACIWRDGCRRRWVRGWGAGRWIRNLCSGLGGLRICLSRSVGCCFLNGRNRGIVFGCALCGCRRGDICWSVWGWSWTHRLWIGGWIIAFFSHSPTWRFTVETILFLKFGIFLEWWTSGNAEWPRSVSWPPSQHKSTGKSGHRCADAPTPILSLKAHHLQHPWGPIPRQ